MLANQLCSGTELSLHVLNNKGLYKPRVSPQQTRPFNCIPYQFQNDRSGQSSSQNPNSYDSNRYQSNRRGQANFNNCGRGRFHASPKVRCPRVASGTPDKDKLHCHYCHKIGHFIKDYRKCIRDEKNAAKFSLLPRRLAL